MIGLIYDKLFKYGDQLKAEGREHDRAIVHECQRLIHEAFYEAEKVARLVEDKEPESMIEKYVLSIPGIQVYHDVIDSVYWYELNGQHFDSPGEVLKYMINVRKPNKEGKGRAREVVLPTKVIMRPKPENTGLPKAVIQISSGKTIAEFESVREASRQTGISQQGISECCRGLKESVRGFQWKFKED